MINYYTDRFRGGVTTGGWSPPADSFGTGLFSISVPAGCVMRRAFLFAGECGSGHTITVTLGETGNPSSNQNFTFDNSTRVGVPFDSSYGSNSSVHSIEVTNFISVNTNNYTLTVPAQTGNMSQRFSDFMLLVSFQNNAMDVVDVCVFLNDQSMASDTHLYNCSFPIPISTADDVAFGLFCGYLCNQSSGDGERIKVNSTELTTSNLPIGCTSGFGDYMCRGSGYAPPRGNLTYSNGTLTALANCNANLAMNGMDALSNIVSLLSNGATALNWNFNSAQNNNYSQNLWACVFVYTDTTPYPVPYECQACTYMAYNNQAQTSIRLVWAFCAGNPASYINNVQYRVVGNTTWTQYSGNPINTDHFADLTGLTAGTNYEWQIINVDNDGAVCAPSAISTFSTLP